MDTEVPGGKAMKTRWLPGLILVVCGQATAAEVTVQNDSLTEFSQAVIVTGFISGGGAGSWLTSPCDGNLVAAQIFWRSQSGTSGETIHQAINIYRSGSFPDPGDLAATIGGPVLNDGVINEWRFLDENEVIPLNVPVEQNETVVVALIFDAAPPSPFGPSVVRDVDGIEAQRNTIFSNFGAGFEWRDASSLGVAGDWVIRAVVDCKFGATEADVSVAITANPPFYTAGEPLNYTVVVSNAGPAAANGATVVDIFPADFLGPSWTCAGSNGASCTPAGSGNITQLVNLPAASEVSFSISGSVDAGISGNLVNTATVVLPGGLTDPDPDNNSATLTTEPIGDPIFEDRFEM